MHHAKPTVLLAAFAALVALVPGITAALEAPAPHVGPISDVPQLPVAGPTPLDHPPGSPTAASSSPTPIGPTAAQADGSDGGGIPLDTPYARFLDGALNAPTDARSLMALLRTYYHDLGFPVITDSTYFDENTTISFTHNVGDVDGDGMDDLVRDQFCNEDTACLSAGRPTILNPVAYLAGPPQCYYPHSLIATSGQNGTEVWNVTLDRTEKTLGVGLLIGACVMEFVVGTVPAGNGTSNILMYRVSIDGPVGQAAAFAGEYLLHHRFYMIDGKTGKTLWTYDAKGFYLAVDPFYLRYYIVASNVFLNPSLQVRPDFRVDLVPKSNVPGFMIQGVGFNATVTRSPVANPFAVRPNVVLSSYQPDEWAAALDLMTGKEVWHRATFQPNERITSTPATPAITPPPHPGHIPMGNRSVVPWVLQAPYNPGTGIPDFAPSNQPARSQKWYWGPKVCCFDQTGDGVPDLLYNVIEYSATPTTNYEGPYNFDERVVLLDGATGKTVYDLYVQTDIAGPIGFGYEFIGDANGDGVGDYVLHQWFYRWDYLHRANVRNGPDGKLLWSHEGSKEFDILPIGDASGDGGNDLAMVNYTFDYSYNGDNYARANVTWSPIRILEGSTGRELWHARTFEAPSDQLFTFELYRLNGLFDADGDHVGDLLADDPLFLPDLTTIHRFTLLSGRTGAPLFKYLTAGTFSFPADAGDVTGDGIEDFYVLNGDVLDLWITTYDGHNGTALWSRRIMTPKESSYASSLPRLRTHVLRTVGQAPEDFTINLHFTVSHLTLLFGRITPYSQTKPQIVRYDGGTGRIGWSLPNLEWDVNLTIVVPGATPASVRYAHALEFQAQEDTVPAAPLATPAQTLIGGASFAGSLAVAFAMARRRWL